MCDTCCDFKTPCRRVQRKTFKREDNLGPGCIPKQNNSSSIQQMPVPYWCMSFCETTNPFCSDSDGTSADASLIKDPCGFFSPYNDGGLDNLNRDFGTPCKMSKTAFESSPDACDMCQIPKTNGNNGSDDNNDNNDEETFKSMSYFQMFCKKFYKSMFPSSLPDNDHSTFSQYGQMIEWPSFPQCFSKIAGLSPLADSSISEGKNQQLSIPPPDPCISIHNPSSSSQETTNKAENSNTLASQNQQNYLTQANVSSSQYAEQFNPERNINNPINFISCNRSPQQQMGPSNPSIKTAQTHSQLLPTYDHCQLILINEPLNTSTFGQPNEHSAPTVQNAPRAHSEPANSADSYEANGHVEHANPFQTWGPASIKILNNHSGITITCGPLGPTCTVAPFAQASQNQQSYPNGTSLNRGQQLQSNTAQNAQSTPVNLFSSHSTATPSFFPRNPLMNSFVYPTTPTFNQCTCKRLSSGSACTPTMNRIFNLYPQRYCPASNLPYPIQIEPFSCNGCSNQSYNRNSMESSQPWCIGTVSGGFDPSTGTEYCGDAICRC